MSRSAESLAAGTVVANAVAADACQTEAVILVADVSSFTEMTVALEQQHGRRGADRLAEVMDALLGALAEIARQHGGRLLDIVGDAVQIAWPVGPQSRSRGLDRAAAAALAMQHHAEQAATIASAPQLRIGIASGPLTIASFDVLRGGELAWGGAVVAASRAAALAPVGACAIMADDVAELDQRFVLTEAGNEVWHLIPWPGTADVARILATNVPVASWSAELRSASVLFCRLVSVDEAAHATVARVERLIQLVEAVTAARGGVLDKVHADDKGIAAVIAFGIPPGPVAEAATRCLGAAVDLRRELRERGIAVAIGVATGKLRSGFGNDGGNRDGGGGGPAAHHILYGATVNLAARCMQASVDEILSDEATRAQAADAFDFLVAAPRRLKGFGNATPVFGVGEPRTATAPVDRRNGQPLAGRHAEVAAIDAFVDGGDLADSSAARLLLITGERGIGKSRLAAHALDRVTARGDASLVVFGDPLATQNPLFAWRQPVMQLLRGWARERDLRLDDAVEELARRAGGETSEAAALAALLGRAAPAGARGSGHARTVRRFQAAMLIDLLTAARRLIVVEEAHWLDDASLGLVRELLELAPAFRIILVSRIPLSAGLAQLVDGTGAVPATVLRLGNLDRDDFATVVRHAAGALDDEHPAIDWFYTRCQGNPLFCGELMRALPAEVLAAGIRTPGAWRDAEAALQDLELPQTIEAAATMRLDAQPPEQLVLLKAASVLGTSFDADALLALGLPVAADELAGVLAALVDKGILAALDTGRYPVWRFSQDLMREVIYGSLPDQMRCELHRRAVAHLQGGSRQRAERYSNQIAHHWLRAGRPDLALRPMRRAAIAARRAGAPAEALKCFSSALALCEQTTPVSTVRRGYLHFDLSRTCWDLGEIERAIVHGVAALDGLWPGLPENRLGWHRLAAGELSRLLAMLGLPPQLRRAPATVRARMLDRLRTTTAMNLSDNLLFSRGIVPAVAMSLYAVRAAERLGDQQLAAAPYAFLGYVAGLLRLPVVARFCFRRPRAACIAADNRRAMGRLLGGEALYHIALARWDEMDRCLALAGVPGRQDRTDRDYGLGITIWLLAQLQQGNFARAEPALEVLYRIAVLHADDQYLLWSYNDRVRLALAHGKMAVATGLIESALRLSARVDDRQSAFISAGLHAIALARSGSFDQLAAQSTALLDSADAAPTAWGAWDAFAGSAEAQLALLAHDDTPSRRADAWRALTRLDQFARIYVYARPVAALHRGQFAALTGSPARAARLWRRGLTVADRAGTRFEAARLHDALARATGDEAHRAAASSLAAVCTAVIPPLPIKPHPERPTR